MSGLMSWKQNLVSQHESYFEALAKINTAHFLQNQKYTNACTHQRHMHSKYT